ncbi:MAG: hypothetical protein U0931_39610 [Vulcanimicrobiota bacterium]
MSRLAKIATSLAPACPNCRNQVTDLDLDQLSAGAEHQCLFCGHRMRVPKALLDRLIAEREANKPAPKESLLNSIKRALLSLFGR